MSYATILNDAFTAALSGRPVARLAALVFVGTSIYVAHAGLAWALPATLSNALTALFVAVAVLQWLAMGRKAECDGARDFDRSAAVIQQAWMFGAIETVLYAAGGLALAREGGMAVEGTWPIAIAGVSAAIFAFANFRVKWVSCDPVGRSNGTPRTPSARPIGDLPLLAHETPPAALPADVYSFDLEREIRRRGELEAREAQALAHRPPQRSVTERLTLTTKRLQTRARRARQRAA